MSKSGDVNLTITDKDNKNYPFLFSKGPASYYLNAGLFPVGNFRYNAIVKTGKEIYQKSGEFYVSENNLESAALIADHNLLLRIAVSHDAEMISPRDLDKLSDKILSRADVRSVSSYQTRISDLISSPWLFVLILALLTAEWILRKRGGK